MQSMVWSTLNENTLYPYHLQKVHLQPGDPARRLDFCNRLNENRHLYATFCLVTRHSSHGMP
jgi:hypothetical protein